MNDPYGDGQPMKGAFLVDLRRPGDDVPYSNPMMADSPEDLAEKAKVYAAQHGFVVVGATFAGHPVPGVGEDQ